MKTAIITGITGQDGSYLAELLLEQGYKVVGLVRRSSGDSSHHLHRISHLLDDIIIEFGDLTDAGSIDNLIRIYLPHSVYNLAAQSHVRTSFLEPSVTFDVNAKGVLYLLEAIRKYSPHTRIYQASTSEMFGQSYTILLAGEEMHVPVHLNTTDFPLPELREEFGEDVAAFQYEQTPFMPQSPYSVAKAAAHHYMQLYRRAYNIHAVCGILMNHESPRRGDIFVTRKITKWIGEFVVWKEDLGLPQDSFTYDGDYIQVVNTDVKFPKLRLGNIDSYRDWGHAKDYVRAMYLMMDLPEPNDWVVSTMETHSVREFLDKAFSYVGLDYKKHFVQDEKFMRPAEVDYLLGNSQAFREATGWEPQISFDKLVEEMVDADVQKAKAAQTLYV